MRQRTSAQLWGKQGALGALIAGIVAGARCLPAAARAAPASDNFGGTRHAAAVLATPGSASFRTHKRTGEPSIPCTGGTMQQGQHAHRRRRLGVGSVLIGGIAASALCLPAAPAVAQTGPVSPTPVAGTPTLVPNGTTEEIRQIADCGGTMYAVGTFTTIGQGGTTYTRNNIFSFS